MFRSNLDTRNSERKKMRRAAWIAYGASPTPVSCVVWDLSDGGARLTAAHSGVLPDVFVLFLAADAKSYRFCRVRWRKKPYLGVQFIPPGEGRVLARFQKEIRLTNAPNSRGLWFQDGMLSHRPCV